MLREGDTLVIAIRGATTVPDDSASEILAATEELLTEMLSANALSEPDLISLFFTVTPDLTTAFPAEAARVCGLHQTPLMCAQEIPVIGALPHCIRIMMHCNSKLTKPDIRHVYLREARRLRPDLQ